MNPALGDDPDFAEDLLLVGRTAAGDRDAFGRLYDRHAALALGVLTRMLGDRATAEEILQETFLQVWQQARRFDAALGRPRSWILMMARSRALDRLRSTGARQRREDAVYHDNPGRTAEPVGTSAIESDERSRVVREALAALPAEQRQALELAFFAGLTHSQIAERLRTPLGTVKSRILLGMGKLRQSMAIYSTR